MERERERPERERKKKRPNMTIILTKSGTKVYVAGNRRRGNTQIRNKAGDQFVNHYNRNFTSEEQHTIGNIYYDLYNRDNDATTSPQPPKGHTVAAATGTFVGAAAQKLNPGRTKMVDLYIRPDKRGEEDVATHEMIHAKKFMQNKRGNRHNERQIDFETVGRVSRHSVLHMHTGYYFSPLGNKELGKRRGMRNHTKGRIAQQGIFHDRMLLTGSMSKSITGKTAERRANSLFRKSFFFKKDLSPFNKKD